jgi:ubiquinone/menaquinone biosynthesis C-methylase UbiE
LDSFVLGFHIHTSAARKLKSMADALKKALETNYNAIGSAMIEKLYSENFLSLSGADGTDRLVAASGTEQGAHVLDIGCGLGGPAMRIASEHGRKVTGVDLVATNVTTARERVLEAGLSDQVQIMEGDATALPFAEGTFDAVFSQDALCHVPDKGAALEEAARVVVQNGAIGLTDWVETDKMTETRRAAVLDALSAPNLQSQAGYEQTMESHGIQVAVSEDISNVFASFYDGVMVRLKKMEAEISERFSPRVFTIMMQKNGVFQTAFAEGSLGGALIVGHRK